MSNKNDIKTKVSFTEDCVDVQYGNRSMCWTLAEVEEDTNVAFIIANAIDKAHRGELDATGWRKGNPHEMTQNS